MIVPDIFPLNVRARKQGGIKNSVWDSLLASLYPSPKRIFAPQMARKIYATRQVHRPKATDAKRSPSPILTLVIFTLILFFTIRFYSISKGVFVLLAVTPAMTVAVPEILEKPKYFDVQVRDTPLLQTVRAPS